MLNTYIKNKGTTQTLVHNNNNNNNFNELNWDADYDGNQANIVVTTNSDGRQQQYDIQLDNEDLANILNIPSINMPIDKRLKMDFGQEQPSFSNKYQIELPEDSSNLINSYLSSPLPDEELIVPIRIDENPSNYKHLKTYKVYKKHKSSKSKSSKSKSSKSKSSKSSKKSKSRSPKSIFSLL